jgi:hypothetical protein
MSAPTNLELLLNHGLSDSAGYRIPATTFNVPVIFKAKNAYEMRIGETNPPSGDWQDYSCMFFHDFVGPSGGTYTLYAQARSEVGESGVVVSDSIPIWGVANNIPMSLLVDSSLYYYVEDILTSAGYIDSSGDLTINLIQEQLEYSIPAEVAEKIYGGEEVSTESVGIPAVAISSMTNKIRPGALGGASWERRFYNLDVYGTTEQESKEIAYIIEEKLNYGVPVYDYNMGFPGISGFPVPNQFLGVFHTENIQCDKVLLPSYSLLSINRRKIIFEIVNMRKTY